MVGDDCMFARNVTIQTHDQHAVVDMTTGALRNPPQDVFLEPHVWVGEGATIGKGVIVGLGSIVGAKSLVLKSCPRFVSVGGVPAKVLVSDVTWDRFAIPSKDIVDRMKAMAARVPAVSVASMEGQRLALS